MGGFSKSLTRRLNSQPTRPAQLPTDEVQVALADGRKFWARRVPRAEWPHLRPGAQLLLIRTSRRREPWQQATEMAQVLDNKLSHLAVPCLVVAWGWLPEGQPDTRHATILLPHELHTVLRYEIRESGCPDVVATIIPPLN